MGSCVSVLMKNPRVPDTRLQRLPSSAAGSTTDSLDVPSSDEFDRADDAALKSQWQSTRSLTAFSDFSNSEIFLDSQPRFESDCEDDFHSVDNDAFTPPSNDNTPLDPISIISVGSLRVSNAPFQVGATDSRPSPYPAHRRKKLAELFRDSRRGGFEYAEDLLVLGNQTISGPGSKSVGGSRTLNVDTAGVSSVPRETFSDGDARDPKRGPSSPCSAVFPAWLQAAVSVIYRKK